MNSTLTLKLWIGLFFFDGKFRPVPLEQNFIGVSEKMKMRQVNMMNKIAYEKTIESLRNGHQVSFND